MEIIIRKPRQGKTTELIKKCAENGGLIVSGNSMRAEATYKMAKELGYNISKPITHYEFIHKMYDPSEVKKFYIDDAHELAQAIAGWVEVAAITVDDWEV